VLVTGGSGFIGTNAVAHFEALGCNVLSLDTRPARDAKQERTLHRCDMLDRDRLEAEFRRFEPDFVVHLAARTDLHETRDLGGYAANIDGTRNVLEAAAGCRSVRRMIVASSRMVCRIGYVPQSESDYCPPNLYGESKVRTEQIVRDSGVQFEWIIIRPTSIWGEWFDIPYRLFFDSIRRGRYRHPAGLDPAKSFGYVGNCVYQLERLLLTGDPEVVGRTIYQCDYPPLRLRAWADLIRREMELPPIADLPLSLLRAAGRAGDVLQALGMRNVSLTSFRLGNLTTEMVYPTGPLERVAGALPFTLAESVRRTVGWMSAQ
jgi:nucleoside-diphosphate-sugar epimerase